MTHRTLGCAFDPNDDDIVGLYVSNFTVRLTPLDGTAYAPPSPHGTSSDKAWASQPNTPTCSTQDIQREVDRLSPLNTAAFGPICVPAVPSADFRVDMHEVQKICSTHGDQPSGRLPSVAEATLQVLATPMVKSHDGETIAFRSGGRSAILCISPSSKESFHSREGVTGRSLLTTCSSCHLFRLKGCGNYLDADGFRFPHPGFPHAAMETVQGAKEVRGCAFWDTSVREVVMTCVVNDLLKQHNLLPANLPVGVWKYQVSPDVSPTEVDKCCVLFRTFGDRRLGTHLLAGLDTIVSLMAGPALEAKARQLFPEERADPDTLQGGGDTSVRPFPTWRALCSSTSNHRAVSVVRSDGSACSDDLTFTLNQLPDNIPNTSGTAMASTMWQDCIKRIKEANHDSGEQTEGEGGRSLMQAMAVLYWRLGMECGRFKRLLEDNDISWGYFIDHNPFEPHCNSHPNNFVVLPQTESQQNQLLAPLDFDMAYSRQSFFSPYSHQYDSELFESWVESERVELERALGGENANTGLAVHGSDGSKQESADWTLALMKDTLVSGYRQGFEMGPSFQPTFTQWNSLHRDFIRMALACTSHLEC